MTTDREALVELLAAVDAARIRSVPSIAIPLRRAADAARRHLLLTEAPDGDCAERIHTAARAAYAAGVARGAGARPDRPGNTYEPPAVGTVEP